MKKTILQYMTDIYQEDIPKHILQENKIRLNSFFLEQESVQKKGTQFIFRYAFYSVEKPRKITKQHLLKEYAGVPLEKRSVQPEQIPDMKQYSDIILYGDASSPEAQQQLAEYLQQHNSLKVQLSFFDSKYSINSLVYWVTYVHNVVYSFYRSMIYCYINSTQRCAGSIVIDIIPTNGADKRKFFPFAPYFPVTNVIKRYFYPYFPAIIGIKGYSFPYFPYLSGIMKIKTALYSLFSRLDWHKTVVFPCLGEIYEGIRSLSWEIPVT